MLEGSPAVRRELEKFELMQIWITDDKIKDLAKKQMKRMQKQFGTVSIPLHAVVDPQGKLLARFVYKGNLSTPEDYLAFLREGMAKFK
jgi:hypothetical protein